MDKDEGVPYKLLAGIREHGLSAGRACGEFFVEYCRVIESALLYQSHIALSREYVAVEPFGYQTAGDAVVIEPLADAVGIVPFFVDIEDPDAQVVVVVLVGSRNLEVFFLDFIVHRLVCSRYQETAYRAAAVL